MDKVQQFIEENQFQLGYIMHEASRKWIENDSVGALTVGDCNFVVNKYGQYHEVLEKMEKYEKALIEILELVTINNTLFNAQVIANNTLVK